MRIGKYELNDTLAIGAAVVVFAAGLAVITSQSPNESSNTANTAEVAASPEEGPDEQDAAQENLGEGTIAESSREGWSTYTHEGYGFSFDFPTNWGSLEHYDVSYGSETQVGPRASMRFIDDCETCDFAEIGVNSRDFGGIGTGRPTALESGYEALGSGKYTIYSWGGNTLSYPQANTLSITQVGDALVFTDRDELHNLDTTKAVLNIAAHPAYAGVSIMVHDSPGETTKADLLKEVAATMRAM